MRFRAWRMGAGLAVAVGVLAVLPAAPAFATPAATTATAECTKTWSGPPANGHWENAADWTPAGVPDATSKVCIGSGDLTMASTTVVTVAQLRLTGTPILFVDGQLNVAAGLTNAGSIQVDPSGALNVADAITNTDDIQVLAPAALSAAALVQNSGNQPIIEGNGTFTFGTTADPGDVLIHAGSLFMRGSWTGRVVQDDGTLFLGSGAAQCPAAGLVGSYTQTAAVTTTLGRGSASCVQLQVSGAVTIAGRIALPPPHPSGARVVLIRADGGITGRYANRPRVGWQLRYFPKSVTATTS